MGKYTKMALVLLYLLQLMVVFREQLVFMYKSALGSADHGTEQSSAQPAQKGGLRAVLERVAHIAAQPDTVMQQTASFAILTAPAVIIYENHEYPHQPHPDPDDEKKDRAPRKPKRRPAHEWLVRNLYLSIRAFRPSSATADAKMDDVIRTLTFTRSSQPAANA